MNRTPFNMNTQAYKLDDSDTLDERFKEFTVYMRNTANKSVDIKGNEKWAKIEVMVEEWRAVHLYRISMVTDMEGELKGQQRKPREYTGIEAK